MNIAKGQYNVVTQIFEREYFSFIRMTDFPFKMNEFSCHAALFLWQLQHFMNMGCLNITVAIASHMILAKINFKLNRKICYYASRMNESSLNDSKIFDF